MKNIFLTVILLLSFSQLKGQSFIINTEYNKFFSGFGDEWGDAATGNLSYKLKGSFYLSFILNIGNSALAKFTVEDLANKDNLLIYDEYGNNYPLGAFTRPFNTGNKRTPTKY